MIFAVNLSFTTVLSRLCNGLDKTWQPNSIIINWSILRKRLSVTQVWTFTPNNWWFIDPNLTESCVPSRDWYQLKIAQSASSIFCVDMYRSLLVEDITSLVYEKLRLYGSSLTLQGLLLVDFETGQLFELYRKSWMAMAHLSSRASLCPMT